MKPNSSIYSRYFTYIKPVTRLPIVKTYGSTIFTLIVIIIFIFFAIKPTVETILVLQKKLTATSDALDKVNKKANDLSLGKQNYDNLDSAIKNKIIQAIPDTVALKSITQTLEQTAKSHDASVSALQIQPIVIDTRNENSVGSLAALDFTFNIEGAYANLTALLQDLASSSRLISIDGLSLSKLTEGSGLIMSITGKGYYIK